MKATFLFLLVFCFGAKNLVTAAKPYASGEKKFWKSIIAQMPEFTNVFKQSKKFRLEIYFTRIHRNPGNEISGLETFHFGDSLQYFYPASTVKLPLAIAVLEDLFAHKSSFGSEDVLQVQPQKFCGVATYRPKQAQWWNVSDSCSLKSFGASQRIPLSYLMSLNPGINENETILPGNSILISRDSVFPSLRDLLTSMLVFSDNDAYNKLLDWIGLPTLNTKLQDWEYEQSWISKRLLYCPQPNAMACVKVALCDKYNGQPKMERCNPESIALVPIGVKQTTVGKKHMNGELVEKGGRDFSMHNRMALGDLHRMIQRVVLHEQLEESARFKFGTFEHELLLRLLGAHPREIRKRNSRDWDLAPDGYANFLLNGDDSTSFASGLRIFNIAGWANGFTVDAAYIADLATGTEFFLSCRMYTNADGIIGDDRYEYTTVASPFMKKLGEVFFKMEASRTKEALPNLTRLFSVFK
jgi:hypothetical protein